MSDTDREGSQIVLEQLHAERKTEPVDDRSDFIKELTGLGPRGKKPSPLLDAASFLDLCYPLRETAAFLYVRTTWGCGSVPGSYDDLQEEVSWLRWLREPGWHPLRNTLPGQGQQN